MALARGPQIAPNRTAVAALATIAVLLRGHAASAQTAMELAGAVSLNYTDRTAVTPDTSGTRFGADIRPSFVLQTESRRLAWRVGYTFAGNVSTDGTDVSTTYSNQVNLGLVAALTPRSSLGVTASASQGETDYLLTLRSADAGQPAIRAPGNPGQISATLGETCVWEASQMLRLTQSFSALASATQDDPTNMDSTLTASLGLSWLFPRDAIGAELRPSISLLKPLTVGSDRYVTLTNSLVGHWSHDFGMRWNGDIALGVQQVLTLAGSDPLTIVPTGGIVVNYLHGAAVGALAYNRSTTSNLQTGTVTVTDTVSVRGSLAFGQVLPRVLSASAGFLHSGALGEAEVPVAAGTGNAIQVDVGLSWALSDTALATARYSLAYQFDQDAGLPSSLASSFLVGITGRVSNVRSIAPMPAIVGHRADGADAVGLPDSNAPPR